MLHALSEKCLPVLKKEPMLTVSLLAAIVALFITPPSARLLADIDWRTLGTLFLMLSILEGFKQENVFLPFLKLAGSLGSLVGLSLFLVFSVFFSSMFVTNDVSLIIFVPLTILLFRAGKEERFILPLLTFENIAAVRGSLLTPFGSPQNLFIFSRSNVTAWQFIRFMFPIWILSAFLLIAFILFLHRKNLKGQMVISETAFTAGESQGTVWKRNMYLALFAVVIWMIVSRTSLWIWVVVLVSAVLLVFDRGILKKTDYVLLLTFLCFFIFSSSIAANESIAAFLKQMVTGREYAVSILVSQLISNVPAAIVLYPFSENIGALLYGLDSAGLCSLIGSLASVINYRIYVREYPKNGLSFIKVFTLISWAFFLFVVIPGYLISRGGMPLS